MSNIDPLAVAEKRPTVSSVAMSLLRVALGIGAILSWLSLLTCGISIGTTSYMDSIDPDNPTNQRPTWEQLVKYEQLVSQGALAPVSVEVLCGMSRADFASLTGDTRSDTPKPVSPTYVAKPVNVSIPQSDGAVESPAGKTDKAAAAERPATNSDPTLLAAVPTARAAGRTAAAGGHLSQADEVMRARMKQEKRSTMQNWLGIFFCNTVVNLGLLSCLASLVGSLYYSTRHPEDGAPDKFGPQWYLSGIIQGFVLYLAVLAGLLALGEAPVEDVTTRKYTHLAGVLSALSFWAGYTPNEFVLGLIGRSVNSGGKQSGTT